ncbi:MAG: transglycosylase domain-containing protein [Kiritimatiellia bacterium]
MRVSLGPGDVDCRPYYRASPDDWIVKALVASEDGSFWTHSGVRLLSMVRAFAQNVLHRRRVSGASTISMQTVRLIRPHRKSYAEKWIEAFRAMKMERRKDKCWILSQYLNRAPFGSNFIGIEAAANGWFGKDAKALGLGEAALLAGMVQAPSRFRPDRAYARALARRDYVLGRMRKLGYITAEQLEGAQRVRPVVCRAARPFRCPYYCDYYLRDVLGRERAAQQLSGDFTTPLDADIQRLCEDTVNAASCAGGYAVAAVVMKVASGEVVALACSGDYFDSRDGQVNTACAPRPAGSTLKPFLTAQALDLGLVRANEMLADAPRVFNGYTPANFDGRYRGQVSLCDALVLSLNLPFVELMTRVGVERFGAKLRALGCTHVMPPYERYGLGLAIGNCEVTLVELVGAYRRLALAAGADAVTPEFSPMSAYLVSEMLSGTARSAAALGHVADVATSRFAWKTGTSSDYRDAWTVLWNPEYVVGIWCGHKYGGFGDKSLVGAKAAAPQAWKIARTLYPQNDGPWFGTPPGVAHPPPSAATPGAADVPTHPPPVLAKPAHGAVFRLVPGVPQQKIVCEVLDNRADTKLWWFVDGRAAGETRGRQPKVLDLGVGHHDVVCSTADGQTAEVSFTIADLIE